MMQRTIKFRTWEKAIKEMDYDPYVNCSGSEDYEVNHAFNDEGKVWMQFTGLTDKNGKEIYEGDIVKGINFENFEWIEPVTFIDNGWFPFIEHRAMTDFEIIGNFYENPELLK